jgi:Family of unknown function (DUF6502)
MSSTSQIILSACLVLIKPLIRLMLKHGITYTSFTAALKKSFVEAAFDELSEKQITATDSAISLLSGIHRRDIRNLTRLSDSNPSPLRKPISASAQLIARWMSDPNFLDAKDRPLSLIRSGGSQSFDALAATTSTDVRPRALLDDLIRLGLAQETEDCVTLLVQGFTPKTGFIELSEQFQNNLHDHLAAACSNLSDDKGFLEQAIYVDELSEESAKQLHKTAAIAWRQAFKSVMRDAQMKFDFDQANTKKAKRKHRIRFGAYFYSSDKD